MNLLEAAKTIAADAKAVKEGGYRVNPYSCGCDFAHLADAISVFRGDNQHIATVFPGSLARARTIVKTVANLLDCDGITVTVDCQDAKTKLDEIDTVAIGRDGQVAWVCHPYRAFGRKVTWLPEPSHVTQPLFSEEGLAHIRAGMKMKPAYPNENQMKAIRESPGFKEADMRDGLDGAVALTLTATGFLFGIESFHLVADPGTRRAEVFNEMGIGFVSVATK